ncbi:uncharacterized protein MKK02DRAFT_31220 [Dioszegia hungarica]|uniref:Uncharacterized protein n=1 Tax=Dioszegia hungarica TaxID=4972 RepID=A0AA38LWZ1_9TREE|nr:uncharacterized protein MKK02DRAFT_31220 [Dioszegia hungarica]KAI9638940.1 hypothetical protein MKK02DRAFT_31220 [Dioszegia hungarica]
MRRCRRRSPRMRDPGPSPAAVKAADRAEKAHRKAINARATKLIKVVESLPSGVVKSVRLVPRPGGASPCMVYLLTEVTNSLERLEIEAPQRLVHQPDLRGWESDSLDCHLVYSGVAFFSLTQLRIGRSAIRFLEIIHVLLDRAPYLEQLDICLDEKGFSRWHNHDALDLPDSLGFWSVEHLCISAPPRDPREGTMLCGPKLYFVDVIECLPGIRRLSISFTYAIDEATCNDPDDTMVRDEGRGP